MDYNIYLHSDESLSKATQPKEMGKKTKPKQTEKEKQAEKLGKTIKKVGGFLSNPDSAVGEAKGAALKKAGLVGIIIAAGTSIVTSWTDKGTDLYATMTGDYSGAWQWNKVKTTIKHILTPISTIIAFTKYNTQLNRANEAARLGQQILGDSQINQNYGRKV